MKERNLSFISDIKETEYMFSVSLSYKKNDTKISFEESFTTIKDFVKFFNNVKKGFKEYSCIISFNMNKITNDFTKSTKKLADINKEKISDIIKYICNNYSNMTFNNLNFKTFIPVLNISNNNIDKIELRDCLVHCIEFYKNQIDDLEIINSEIDFISISECILNKIFLDNSKIIRYFNMNNSNIGKIFESTCSNINELFFYKSFIKYFAFRYTKISYMNISYVTFNTFELNNKYQEKKEKLFIKIFNSNFVTFNCYNCLLDIYEINNTNIYLVLNHSDIIFSNEFSDYNFNYIKINSYMSEIKNNIYDKTGQKITLYINNNYKSNISEGFYIIPAIYKIRFDDECDYYRVKIGCKIKSLKDWNYFFSDECDEWYDNMRDSENFALIKEQYFNFIRDNQEFIEKHNIK